MCHTHAQPLWTWSLVCGLGKMPDRQNEDGSGSWFDSKQDEASLCRRSNGGGVDAIRSLLVGAC